MFDTLGQSFDPTQHNPMQPQQGGGNNASPVQQAIQILRVRMPHVFGANAPAPGALLNSQGAGGLLPVIARMFQQFGTMPPAGGGVASMTPPPMGHGPMPPAPQAPPAPQGPAPQGPPPQGTPGVHYQPLPGGTAGPGPRQPMPHSPFHSPFGGRFQQ